MLARERVPDVAFAAACLAALVILLWLASGLTFFHDEWFFILRADEWSLRELMQPHNEHWVLGPKLVYKILMATVGMRSYMPYLLVLILLHIAVASAVYVYAQRQTAALIAVAAGVLFLFLGSGWQNIFWAFQIGFTGAAAAGAWALVVVLREPAPRRVWVVAVLLLISVATSGVGLFFLFAATAALAISPERRRHLWVVVPAALAYGAWYVIFGSDTVGEVASASAVASYAKAGIAHAVAELTGLGPDIGLVVAVLFAVAILVDLVTGDAFRPGVVAGVVGLLSQWLIIGLARGDVLAETFDASRYVHIAATFILIAFVGWLGKRHLGRPRSSGLAIVVAGVTAVALVANVERALQGRDLLLTHAGSYRAAMALLLEYGGSPALPESRGLAMPGGLLRIAEPGDVPLIRDQTELEELFERYGSVLEDPMAPGGVAIPDGTIDHVFREAVGDMVTFSPGEMPEDLEPVALEGRHGVDVKIDAECLALEPTADDPAVHIAVPSGVALYAASDVQGTAELFLSLRGTYPSLGQGYEAQADTIIRIGLPDIGPSAIIRIRFHPPIGGSTRLCASRAAVTGRSFDLADLAVRPATAAPLDPIAPEVLATSGVLVQDRSDGCVDATVTGSDAYVEIFVPDGEGLYVTPTRGGPAQVFLDTGTGYSEEESMHITLGPQPYEIFMPSRSHPAGWAIRIDLPDDQATSICLVLLAAP